MPSSARPGSASGDDRPERPSRRGRGSPPRRRGVSRRTVSPRPGAGREPNGGREFRTRRPGDPGADTGVRGAEGARPRRSRGTHRPGLEFAGSRAGGFRRLDGGRRADSYLGREGDATIKQLTGTAGRTRHGGDDEIPKIGQRGPEAGGAAGPRGRRSRGATGAEGGGRAIIAYPFGACPRRAGFPRAVHRGAGGRLGPREGGGDRGSRAAALRGCLLPVGCAPARVRVSRGEARTIPERGGRGSAPENSRSAGGQEGRTKRDGRKRGGTLWGEKGTVVPPEVRGGSAAGGRARTESGYRTARSDGGTATRRGLPPGGGGALPLPRVRGPRPRPASEPDTKEHDEGRFRNTPQTWILTLKTFPDQKPPCLGFGCETDLCI